MWHRRQVCFLAILVIMGQIVIAQNCDALLDHGLYNLSAQTSYSDYEERFSSEICSQEYSSSGSSKQKSMSAGLSYAGFGVSGSSRKIYSTYSEAQKSYCEEKGLEIGSTKSFSSTERTLVTQAISAWETCSTLQLQKFFIETEISTITDTARFTLSDKSGSETLLQGVYVKPDSEAFTCTTNKDGQEVELSAASSEMIGARGFTIVCTRNFESKTFEEEDYQYSQAATIIIPTAKEEIQIDFGEVIKPANPISKRINDLEVSIGGLESRIEALETNKLDGLGIKIIDNVKTDFGGLFTIPNPIQSPQSIVGITLAIRNKDSTWHSQVQIELKHLLSWNETEIHGEMKDTDFGLQPISLIIFYK